ncbi:MAG: metallophosphoesterase [Myxococcales bacterium]|nr:metallophosphoesterase [Myxococcales bacterium]
MTTLVLSDIHLGNGAGYDIFAGEAVLPALLDAAARQRMRVILNGDTFDFLMNEDPLALTAAQASAQARAIAAHPPTAAVLQALGRVLAAGGEVVVRLGNHDAEVALSEVQAVLRAGLQQPPAVAERLVFARGDAPQILEVGGSRILLAHGEHNDPWNRLDYGNLPQQGDGAAFRYPPGSRLVKTLLNPLKRKFGMRFADLLKPDFQGAVLTALAVDPTALRLVFQGGTAKLLWQLFNKKFGEGMTFADGEDDVSAGEGNLGVADAIEQAGLTDAEREAIELAVDESAPASFGDDDGALDGARFKLARAGLKLYAAAQRAMAGDTGEHYFALAPDPGEWTEAQRLAKKYEADAVVLGHTHSARWKQDDGLAFVNTGTWIYLMRLPAAADGDDAWHRFLDLARRNPSLDRSKGDAPALLTRFTGLVIHEDPRGGAQLQLCEWQAGAPPQVLAQGSVPPHRRGAA